MKEEVSFSSSSGASAAEDQTLAQLSGDLYLPSSSSSARQVPVIVVVAGSGPIDRDGNAKSMPFNTSNRFADHVIARSEGHEGRECAVLTYDKRGIGKSAKHGDKGDAVSGTGA